MPNEGQWEEDFLYKAVAPFADIYLERTGITYLVGAEGNAEKMHRVKDGHERSAVTLDYHAYKMKWIGAKEDPELRPNKKQPFYHNYYLGSEPSRWKSKVGLYRNVDYVGLYPNIDLHFTSSKGNAKYDFIVKPGGDVSKIQFRYEGLDRIHLSKGNLILSTSVGEIVEMAPYAYQFIDGEKQQVACNYLLSADDVVYFDLPEGYDPSVNLIIDPVIVFASLTGSTADNWGFTATYDAAGNLYAGGIANGLGYPTTTGAFQTTFGGGSPGSMPCDITISKFNADGTSLLYSTYLGGDLDDMPHSMIVDEGNNLILSGKTLSANFPTTNSAYSRANRGGYDILITKFNSAGTALLASTYVGGSKDDGVNISPSFYGDQNTLKFNYGDGSRSEVIVDRQGNIYLAANTQSADFPVTPNAARNTLGGNQDGVFLKFDRNLSSMIYGTHIGGSADDAAYVIALDTSQRYVYVGGGTSSRDFHSSVTGGSYRSAYQGGVADGYICRFLNGGNYDLQRATFIGTSEYDQCYGLQIDKENNIYAMGQTTGAFPVSAGTYSNPGSSQFLVKLRNDLSGSIYSTVFGDGTRRYPNISPVAFLVDTCQNVYISGWASKDISTGSSTLNLPVTADAFQNTTDGSDFYFIVLSKDASSLLFASYFGSPGKAEHVDGGTSRFDPDGVVYQAICASCGRGSAFPSTPGAVASTKGSFNCNLGAVKIAFNLGSVKAAADASPKTSGCAPLEVNFLNHSSNATSFFWDFDDGGATSTSVNPTHTFTTPGVYRVMLAASNPKACLTEDTTYLEISVSVDSIKAQFDFTLEDTCTRPKLTINNTSQARRSGSLASASFFWDFGDGNSYNGQNPPVHYYAGAGTYGIMLVMTDTAGCNSPDTFRKTVLVEQVYVSADMGISDTLCLGKPVTFQNLSQNASYYQWDFGDGTQSSETEPSHTFPNVGDYTIWLKAYNPLSCNKVDSISKTISIAPSPTAAFSFSPPNSEVNVPYSFNNQSKNATSYLWDFGDGTQSTVEHPVHAFVRSGTYSVCLIAVNEEGCVDKTCKILHSEVMSLADVPSAFSPNGDGANDVLYVRGYNIDKIDFRVYNRWGELVFETQDVKRGWDGTYKGTPQEMDAYAYILEATFLDGSKANKKGSVTLLR